MDIKCKKCDCKFNKGCCCTAKRVKVGTNIDCETYEYSKTQIENLKQYTSKNMYEISKPLSPHEANKEVKIFCDAKCLFNNNGVCHSNGITVLEKKNKIPYCVTQMDK